MVIHSPVNICQWILWQMVTMWSTFGRSISYYWKKIASDWREMFRAILKVNSPHWSNMLPNPLNHLLNWQFWGSACEHWDMDVTTISKCVPKCQNVYVTRIKLLQITYCLSKQFYHTKNTVSFKMLNFNHYSDLFIHIYHQMNYIYMLNWWSLVPVSMG